MKEFKHNTKVGQKVYLIELNLRSDEDEHKLTNLYKTGLFVTELKIVYQTDRKIALSDEFITLLDRTEKGKKIESYQSVIGEGSISIKTNEDYFPNGIFARVYSLTNTEKDIANLKAKVVSEIRRKYGFLANGFEDRIYKLK